MKKTAIIIFLVSLVVFSACQTKDATNEWDSTIKMDRVSIHDPSITSIVENGEEVFYVFGSHLAQAKSKDLITWDVPFQVEYENPDSNLILGDLDKNLKESFDWAGKDDADSSGGYSIWAPDVIWNPDYIWEEGAKGAYMYFYSATSTWRRSNIGFGVSKSIEGPYTYRETIVYSGFSEVDSTDGSERNINYENTHLKKLIDSGIVEAFSPKWVKNSGTEYNTDYAPNAIDPAVFFDEQGKLWMTYGSWSGGIYILELNKETGIPLYPGKDSETDDKIVDRYFGTKLIGGYHQSGEGPYVVFDDATGYYYLFVTYGQLQSAGGYNMRLFRSENPDGPYTDMKNQTPIFSKTDQNSQYGIKIMGNYKFSNMTKAYKSAGHNSAIITQDNQWLLVYHTRFTGGEAHEVRVHPMMMNANDWPVTLPFEYSDNQYISSDLSQSDIFGDYEFINHGATNDSKVLPLNEIKLNEEKNISGDCVGTWEWDENGNYITFIIDNIKYEGVITRQRDETKNKEEKIVFSAIGEDNTSIWGVKK